MLIMSIVGPLLPFIGGSRCCGGSPGFQHSSFLQVPLNYHTLMKNSDDRDHLTSDLKIDRKPTDQRLEISLADRHRPADLPSRCDVFKHIDYIVSINFGLFRRPHPRSVDPDIFEILFRRWAAQKRDTTIRVIALIGSDVQNSFAGFQ